MSWGKIAEIIKYGKPFDNENHYATDNHAILNILKKSVYDPLHKQGSKRPEKDINREIDQIINHYVAQAEEIAYGTLVRFWPAVDEIAERLIRKKTLNGDEIREILVRNWPAPARAAACQFEIT